MIKKSNLAKNSHTDIIPMYIDESNQNVFQRIQITQQSFTSGCLKLQNAEN